MHCNEAREARERAKQEVSSDQRRKRINVDSCFGAQAYERERERERERESERERSE